MSAEAAAFPWEAAILDRSSRAGLAIPDSAIRAMAAHARAVLDANARLHLTTVVDPREFVERHIGESLVGAALIDETMPGAVVDLGSGNGYPGVVIALARPRLDPVLLEASSKKAAFLRSALAEAGLTRGRVVERHVTRAMDLDGVPEIAVLATRAMGDWERIVPRLVPRLASDGAVLVWTTTTASDIFARAAWRRLRVDRLEKLPGRDRSIIALLKQRR